MKFKIWLIICGIFLIAIPAQAVTGNVNLWFWNSAKNLLRLVKDFTQPLQILIRSDDNTATSTDAFVEIQASSTLALYVNPDLYVNGNVTTTKYFWGQPLDGGLGSGIIWAGDVDSEGNANIIVEDGTLNIHYPDMTVRLAKTDNTITYCDITNATTTATNEQHTVWYVDSDCNVNTTDIGTYLSTNLSPGGVTDFMNAMAHNGEIEVKVGATLSQKESIKARKNIFFTSHLDVVSGLTFSEGAFPAFITATGTYNFINEIMDATAQNTAEDNIELVYHTAGDWDFDNTKTGLVLDECDDGTDLISCSNPTRYRRYFIFLTGFDDSFDSTELHQLAALDDVNYSNLGNCLNIIDNPISYTLPDFYEFANVPLYIYCGTANDNDWNDGALMDLRTVKSANSTVEINTSVFLLRDGSFDLTNDWFAGTFEIESKNLKASTTNATTTNTDNLTVYEDTLMSGNATVTGNLWVSGETRGT